MYAYHGKSLRVEKVASGTTTVYIFSGTRVLAEYQNGAAPSSPTREYIYSGGSLLAKIESGAVQYYHPDQLSVRLMTDSNGNVIGQQAHYPFGESWYQTNTTTKWFFTAGVYPERSRRERDSESGNDYATFRYNLNRFGRFASPDLLAGSIGDPQSLNRYAYVRNDPVNLVDPLGLTDCDPADEKQGYCAYGGESSGDGDPYNPAGGYLEPATGSGPGCTWDPGSASLNCPLPGDPLSGSEAASYLSYLQTGASTMGGYPVGIAGPGDNPFGGLGKLPLQRKMPSVDLSAQQPCSELQNQSPARYAFVSQNYHDAQTLAALGGTTTANILGLSAFESRNGTSPLAVDYGNYFGLTYPFPGSGPASPSGFSTYATGQGIFPSGISLLSSPTQGPRIAGTAASAAFAAALTTPPMAFNSEPGYAGTLLSVINSVQQMLNCIR